MPRRVLPAALLGLLALPALAQGTAQGPDPSFRVVNNTARAINELYASPATERAWGHDRLGADVVPPGGRQVIRLPQGTCLWDVRVVWQGGGGEERRGIDTCRTADLVFGGGGAAAQTARQGNPSFNLVNQGGRVIAEFYASPASQGSWGPDRLPQGTTVPPGQSIPVRLPQGECSYDIRTVWADGQATERRGVNTCALVNYVVR
ncbi:hypothetical protein [Roseicella aquatilis]|uniref:Tat pathway signal protein n=1 Tax=Roseicella aquatilis TaxID=2527868 RepID=A0A4R4D8C5_9PROT|nr:hypothetical protein [Roseicella aquatilis]TCZ56745.1 hypothetical protein EXY23_19360 [Roseicella aquatilis]